MLVVANWKMHGSSGFVQNYVTQLLQGYQPRNEVSLAIAAPFIYISTIAGLLKQTTINIAGQDVSAYQTGAYTGDVAASMLCDLNCTHVILGHSERRLYFAENNDIILKKLRQVLKYKIKPILCIGETKEDFDSGQRESVIQQQLQIVLEQIDKDKTEITDIVIAYEPIWAIGTGLSATPEQAQLAHKFIRSFISHNTDTGLARRITIVYGGSVKPDNAEALASQPDINGFLVGGASLDPQSLLAIYNSAYHATRH